MKIPINKSRIPHGTSFFDNISDIEIEKEDLFKLGIFKHEVPAQHEHESDFLYLLSKVSAYIQLYSEFIVVKGNSIYNTSRDDRAMKDVSEIVGIALGIKLTIDCFDMRQERITKIAPPNTRQKYLDYKFTYKKKNIELETKGTTSPSIGQIVTDILKKKASKAGAHFQYGTVAVLSKPGKHHGTELHLCDDPPRITDDEVTEGDIPWHYISALSYVLDNRYYNELVRTIILRKKPRKTFAKIKDRFFGKYIYQGAIYLGEFYDYRVNTANILAVSSGGRNTVNDIFRKVTKEQGRNKIFIGLHSEIVDLILKRKGLKEIFSLKFERIKETSSNGIKILRDSDGIIVVISPEKYDSQIENQFPETEVKNRIVQMVRLERHEPVECGAPCRSREKAGKPCEIKTYRGACHFHR